MNRPETIKIQEAAKILGIGRDAAYAAVRNGEIPSILIGKRRRVPVRQLERLLEANRPFGATAEILAAA